MSSVDAMSAAIGDQLAAHADPDALHAAALLDVLWADSAEVSLRRAISSLRTASHTLPNAAPVLADLSAALLVRAERTGSAPDLVDAADVSQRALSRDSGNTAARFNLALSLDRLGLDGQAQRAWRHYLTVDSTSGWATEARLFLAAVQTRSSGPGTGGQSIREDASVALIDDFATAQPQAARVLGWDRWLGAWAADLLAGDTAQAGAHLRQSGVLGAALVRRGGDGSLALAVTAILSHGIGDRRVIARAHRAYASGREAYAAGEVERAAVLFHTARSAKVLSRTLGVWAAVQEAAALVESGRSEQSQNLADALAGAADSTSQPALAAQILWARGTARSRSGHYEAALLPFQKAERLFARAGERENAGALQFYYGDALYALGDVEGAEERFYRALQTLRPYRSSVWLHNTLLVWAEAISDGPIYSANRLQDEGVEVAVKRGSAIYVAESRIARARLRIAIGDTASAVADVVAAIPLVQSMRPGKVRGWLTANLQGMEPYVGQRTPEQVVAALDSAVAFFHAIDNPALELTSRIAKADAELARNDTALGARDLEEALRVLARERAAIATAPLRATLLSAARVSVDRLTMMRIGQPRAALAFLEQSRASLTEGTVPPREAGLSMAHNGSTVIDYALIGDTLLIWTVRKDSVSLYHATTSAIGIRATVARVTAALALRVYDQRVETDLSTLYDQLVRPIESHLGPNGGSVVIIADGELDAIPFAALRDRIHGQFLVERSSLRLASSQRDVIAGSDESPARQPVTLIVADPAFAPGAYPELQRLAGARAEAESIAAIYPLVYVLRDVTAARNAVIAALSAATVVHFAGHALLDADQPSRSYLVLAQSASRADDSRMTAAEIQKMDLRHVRLVVLSACETSVAAPGRSGGLSGLSGAFLTAGAHGVIGSLWRVDDRFTQPLMISLHRRYAAHGDAAEALRSAQLEFLHGSDVVLRAPFAWAGFRYAGA